MEAFCCSRLWDLHIWQYQHEEAILCSELGLLVLDRLAQCSHSSIQAISVRV